MVLLTDYVRRPEYVENNGDLHYIYLLISTILLIIILTILTIFRAFESRNQWREMIEDGDVEIMEKMSYKNQIEKEIDSDE